jgi:hypothetical protein
MHFIIMTMGQLLAPPFDELLAYMSFSGLAN